MSTVHEAFARIARQRGDAPFLFVEPVTASGRTTTVAPATSGPSSSVEASTNPTPLLTSTTLPGWSCSVSRPHSNRLTSARWEIAAPFGRPVVPEV